MDRRAFRSRRVQGEFGWFLWWADPRDCPHENEHACPTCDHDGYHRKFLDGGGQ